MSNLDDVIVDLEGVRRRLAAKLDARGGRGVSLANALDRVSFAIDSLKGELFCLHCSARLTSEDNGFDDQDDNEEDDDE
jgi:hypothetical protein